MESWSSVLGKEKEQDYFKNIISFVDSERSKGKVIYPKTQDVFNAFKLTELANIKVVILGQDPYHGNNQAHGLAFSVNKNIPIPPSLQNIYKELAEDIIGFKNPGHGNLTSWSAQGVFLLNTVLTVEAGKAFSHANIGWEIFTDKVISVINNYLDNVVFLLWGAHAQKKAISVDSQKHYILKSPHPSPLAAHRGFFGCKHFSKTNEFLISKDQKAIDWIIP